MKKNNLVNLNKVIFSADQEYIFYVPHFEVSFSFCIHFFFSDFTHWLHIYWKQLIFLFIEQTTRLPPCLTILGGNCYSGVRLFCNFHLPHWPAGWVSVTISSMNISSWVSLKRNKLIKNSCKNFSSSWICTKDFQSGSHRW